MKASACWSSRSAWYSWISCGLARREPAPTSQALCSGPRKGLVSSARERGAEAPPPQPAARSPSRRTAAARSSMTEKIEELLPHPPLVEDPAERRGHRQRSGLLDPAHLDAEVPRLDDHHGSQGLELLLQESQQLLAQAP